VHGHDQHHRQHGKQHARNQLEQKRLDPVVEFQQKPAIAILDRIIAEMIRIGEISRGRLELGVPLGRVFRAL